MSEISHADLVKIAAVWLAGKCRVVATELTTATSETPDAIGWDGRGRCILVECKTSRSDFQANKHKPCERSGTGVGNERWFLIPAGLVEIGEVPDGWGLLEHKPSGHQRGYFIRKKVRAPSMLMEGYALMAEKIMLISIAARSLEACRRLKPLWLGEETEGGEEWAT